MKKDLKEILKRRLSNFKKWNEELKGNYVGKIVTLERRIKELENKNEDRKNNINSSNLRFGWFVF